MILTPNLLHHQRHQFSDFHSPPPAQPNRQPSFAYPFDLNLSFQAPLNLQSSTDTPYTAAPTFAPQNQLRSAITRRYMQRNQPKDSLRSQSGTPDATQNTQYGVQSPLDGSWSPTLCDSRQQQQQRPQQPQQLRIPYQFSGHKRTSSGSTIASSSQGPASPFTPLVGSQSAVFESDFQLYRQLDESNSNAIFHDNIQPAYVSSDIGVDLSSSVQNADQGLQYHDMRQPMSQHSDSGVTELGRQLSRDSEYEYKTALDAHNSMSKLNRTISDIYQDELYNPHAPTSISQPSSEPRGYRQNSVPHDVFSERLQAARTGHMSTCTTSPTQPISRNQSPFQLSSQYAAAQHHSSQSPIVDANGHVHQIQPVDGGVFATNDQTAQALENSQTMSPKEALIEAGNSAMPLHFPCEGDFIAATRAAQASIAAFHQPSQYAFMANERQSENNTDLGDGELEFHVHMASTENDTHNPISSEDDADIQRPSSTKADSGTYTCTYHGCTMRFETPAKLQRHKREAHRQSSPQSDYAAHIQHRNSQAGPHKCERINPCSGKPCNSIFSRPYDLTRHEDTIHNVRKQKVRCHLCTEEKTFSRNDALTRHMRVVHPEIEFPGKSKRKGA